MCPRALATREWKVGLPANPRLIEPHSVEEVVKKAKPSAKRRLLYALEMRDSAAFCKDDHRRYKQTTKIELLTIQSKAPRVYQAPFPSRTLALAPFWSAWQQAMKGHAFSVKGLSSNARAALIGRHAEMYGGNTCFVCIAGMLGILFTKQKLVHFPHNVSVYVAPRCVPS